MDAVIHLLVGVRDWFAALPTTVQLFAWLVVLSALVGVAVYWVRRLRDQIKEGEAHPSEMLSNFREMHEQGDLSDAEFRTIKTTLGAKLQNGPAREESKHSGSKS